MNPRFSVIIPTYNQANFLKKAIESVINQTYKDWELIIIDNYSTDVTVDIVKQYINENILFFQLSNDGVIAKSRNKGINESRGEYIAFLDSDDYWYPHKLETINKILNTGKFFVCHSEKWTYLNEPFKDKIVNYGPSRKSSFYSLLFNGNCISTSAVVVEKKCLLQTSLFSELPNLITAEDYDLWLKLADINIQMTFSKEILGEYLLHPQSNSNSSEKNMNAILECFNSHYIKKRYKGFFYSILRQRRISFIYYVGARGLYSNKIYDKSKKLYLKSIIIWPFNIKVYISLLQLILKIKP